jgi:hypothetical protein
VDVQGSAPLVTGRVHQSGSALAVNITRNTATSETLDEVRMYNPKIIEEYAQKLYSRANAIVLVYTVFGGILLGVPSGVILNSKIGIIGALFGLFLGM